VDVILRVFPGYEFIEKVEAALTTIQRKREACHQAVGDSRWDAPAEDVSKADRGSN
jgi:hypothetical protein